MSEQMAVPNILHRRQNKSRAATPSSPQSNTSLGRRLVTVVDKVNLVSSVTISPSLVVRVMVHKTLPFVFSEGIRDGEGWDMERRCFVSLGV